MCVALSHKVSGNLLQQPMKLPLRNLLCEFCLLIGPRGLQTSPYFYCFLISMVRILPPWPSPSCQCDITDGVAGKRLPKATITVLSLLIYKM